MPDMPPFDEAIAAFLRMVEEQGFSTDLLWVFREDVTNYRRNIWMRMPVPIVNADRVRRFYDQGRRDGFGVNLEVLCRLDGRSACFAWLSGHERDGKPLYDPMQGSLCLKTPIDPIEARAIRARWAWTIRCTINRWHGRNSFSSFLPSRQDAAD